MKTLHPKSRRSNKTRKQKEPKLARRSSRLFISVIQPRNKDRELRVTVRSNRPSVVNDSNTFVRKSVLYHLSDFTKAIQRRLHRKGGAWMGLRVEVIPDRLLG